MKRFLSAIVMLSLILVALSGCGGGAKDNQDKDKKEAAPEVKEIVLGVVSSLTGTEAKFGEAQKRGYDIALEEINAKGGVLGKKIRLDYQDDASKPEIAISSVEKLATQVKVPLIMGAYSSGNTLPASKKATEYKVPFIVPTASADNITEQKSKYTFRITSPSSQYASNALDFLKEAAKPRTIAIIYENTNFGTSTAGPAKKFSEDAGIKVVAYESYSKGAPDFKPLLNKVKAEKPDAVLFVSYLLDATLLMRQSKELDFNPKVYLGAGAGFSASEFIRDAGAGKAAEFTFSSTLWTPDAKWKGAKEFDEKFFKLYNVHPEYHAVQGYVSLYLAVDAINRAGSLDREKIRDALAATDLKETAFGPIKFNDKGQNTHQMLITQVQNVNGKLEYVTVYPADVAVGKPILPTPVWSQRK